MAPFIMVQTSRFISEINLMLIYLNNDHMSDELWPLYHYDTIIKLFNLFLCTYLVKILRLRLLCTCDNLAE
jgi:hypothetical protein